MGKIKKLNIGIAGACGRGKSFRYGCEAAGVNILAVCDINSEGLEKTAAELKAKEKYMDYETMLEKSGIDAVIIGTPMHLHNTQAIQALKRDIHVLSEVTASISLEECRELVKICRKSNAVYMMAENYAYMRPNMVIKELVKRSLFGEIYYAEGEYLHELKELFEITKWRRKWHTGISGITYGTHSLGPILQWMDNDRVIRVCCEDTEFRYRDPRGKKYAMTTPIMLCKTKKGALIKIRMDVVSERPHAMTNYQLQGTTGSYESSRAIGDFNKIWLRYLSKEVKWHDLDGLLSTDIFAKEFIPEMWQNPPEIVRKIGHGGADYYLIQDFVNTINGKRANPIDIDKAMDMTLPGLISQQSILENGQWLEVPDSRDW